MNHIKSEKNIKLVAIFFGTAIKSGSDKIKFCEVVESFYFVTLYIFLCKHFVSTFIVFKSWKALGSF